MAEAHSAVKQIYWLSHKPSINLSFRASVPAQSEIADAAEREELAKFREEWKAEVRQRKSNAVSTASTSTFAAQAPPEPEVQHSEHVRRELPRFVPHVPPSSFADVEPASSSAPAVSAKSKDPASMPLPPKLSRALEVYEQAVLHEQRSELDEALRLYRQAFRMDENVGKVYERLEHHSRIRTEGASARAHDTSGHAKKKSDGGIDNVIEGLGRFSFGKSTAVATGTLAHLVADWPSNLTFEPEEETEPIFIRVLPDELLVHILQFLDVTALERFASINKKARILSLDSSIWR